MLESPAPLAIPLWINGHAFLTLAPAFHDVINRQTGAVIRRTPLCGPTEANLASETAQLAINGWKHRTDRAQFLSQLGDALTPYAEHFARLIAEETGTHIESAEQEVAQSVSLLRSGAGRGPASATSAAGVFGIVGSTSQPLLGALRLAGPILEAGGAVIIAPDPQAPSALFALAELSGQCGFPVGIISIIHGKELMHEGLRSALGKPILFAQASAPRT